MFSVEKRNFWILISSIIILIGLSFMISRFLQTKPILNYGIDFIGGNTFHLYFHELNKDEKSIIHIEKIRKILKPFKLENSQIQFSNNNDVFIKTTAIEKNKTSEILNEIEKIFGKTEVLEIDFIGPSVGKTLQKQAILISVFVTILLLLYITIRFQFSFGIAAIIALTHDILIIFSTTSLLNIEINIAFIAALLTILGYSINDTIVIFDRIRENINENTHENIITTTNHALNQTLRRTINTSVTTLLVITSLIIFGGETIQEFCIILATGIISGTYSSLCIASPIFAKYYTPPHTY